MERNHNGGFTLLETLLTVAILVILLGLSLVGAAYYRDYLKITELDNEAREIYMAAENRAVLLQNSGASVSLLSLGGSGTEKKSRAELELEANSDLLPKGTIDPALWSGDFCVVYDKMTGHVKEVFYAEKTFGKTEADLEEFSKDRSHRVSLFRGGNTLVGYYGSDVGDPIVTRPLPTPGVEVLIENGEELTLTVTYTMPEGLPADVDRTPEVTLEYDGEEIDLWTSGRKTGGPDITLPTTTSAKYVWVLDSLEQNPSGAYTKQFKSLFSGTTPALGKNFTVTASLTLKAGGWIDSSYYATGADNSLFAKQTGDGTTAYIANLRHLQNLRAHDDGVSFTSKVRDDITKAIQTEDIECEEYKNNQGAVLNPAYKFTPITNEKLSDYDGQNKHIRNLSTIPGSAAAGLFGTVSSNLEVRNTRVCWTDPKKLVKDGNYVYAVSGTNAAGGLIGSVTGGNVTIQNSFAATTVQGPAAGGLVGARTGGTLNIENSYADCYLSGTNAAGLVGSGSAAKLENCYAAGFIVEPGAQTAGLVNGSADTAQKCYSVVRVLKADGTPEKPKTPKTPLYTNATDTGSVFYLSKAAADVTDVVKGKLGNAFEYSKKPETHVYNLRYEMSKTPGHADEALKLTPPYPFPGLNGLPHYSDWAELEDDKPLALELVYYEEYEEYVNSKDKWGLRFSKQFTEANPDSNTLKDEKKTEDTRVIVRDGYALAVKDEELTSLQAQKTAIVWSCDPQSRFEWTLEYSGSQWQWSGQSSEDTEPNTETESGYTLIPLPMEMVYGENIPATTSSNLIFNQKLAVTVGTSPERTFYFNPHLPIEIQGPTADGTAATEPGNEDTFPIKIRTPRHFYDLSRIYWSPGSSDSSGSSDPPPKQKCYYPQANVGGNYTRTFEQAFDLDYATYKGQLKADLKEDWSRVDLNKLPYKQNCINCTTYFTYDGQYHSIRNVFIDSNATGNIGLFWHLSDGSELKNIVFEMEPGGSQPMGGSGSGSSNKAGALVGYLSSDHEDLPAKVTNCAVYGVNIDANAAYIGGLVGDCGKNSIVDGCSAEVACLGGSGTIGGLVGRLGYSTAKLRNSYAVGYIEGNEFVGGLVGNMSSTNTEIKNCYAAVRLVGTTKYGLCPNKGKVSNSCWLTGTFRYRGETYIADTSTYNGTSKGSPITPAGLVILAPANSTVYYDISGAPWNADYEGQSFPYRTGVKDKNGAYIHYGLWPVVAP